MNLINEDNKFGVINYGDPWGEDDKLFYLDHSCDEWVIGDLSEAKQFLKDLQKTIELVENQEDSSHD